VRERKRGKKGKIDQYLIFSAGEMFSTSSAGIGKMTPRMSIR